MRNKLLGSLTALLAGTGLVLADPPAAPSDGLQTAAAAPAPAAPAPGPGAPAASAPVTTPPLSPYWPNPLAKLECLSCQLPLGECDVHGRECAPGQIWANAEYLLWWVKNGPAPVPLVTTGTGGSLGVFGDPNTTTLFGGHSIGFDAFSGGRFSAGVWFDRGQTWGVEGGGFLLERRSFGLEAASTASGAPVLARPVINAVTGTETVELISSPGVATGSVDASSSTHLYGWDVNFLYSLYRDECTRADFYAGYRYINLNEDLSISDTTMLLPGGSAGFGGVTITVPTAVTVGDLFTTRNLINAGQVGVRYEWNDNHFFTNFICKVGLGENHEVLTVGGTTQETPVGGTTSVLNGGLLALSSNSGRFAKDKFVVIPEIGLNAGIQINPLLRFYIGYNFLYISDVIRPGDQVNRVINPSLVPTSTTFGTVATPAAPTPVFKSTDFWAQGVNFGVEVRY